MKSILAVFALLFALSHTALASTASNTVAFPNDCGGSLIGDCDGDNGEDDDTPRFRQCFARDSAGRRYSFTASYQYPNKYIVAGAVKKCRAQSDVPSSCHSTACQFVKN